jgi:hypothetical protein
MNKSFNLQKFIFSICVFFILIQNIHAQPSQWHSYKPTFFKSSSLDTILLLSDKPLKSPMGAVFRSALIPGWGQVYTKHYLKAGIAAGINGSMIYQIINYQRQWKDTGNRDFQLKRDSFTWYFAATYFLTMVDAYVNAYLYKFDDAMKISQLFWMEESVCFTGLCISLHF